MAIVPMQKIAVIADRKEENKLVEFLHKEGVMEVTNVREPSALDHQEVNYRASELDYAIGLLKELADKQTIASLAKITPEQVANTALHGDIRGILDQLQAIEKQDQELSGMLQSVPEGASTGSFEQPAYFTSPAVEDQTAKISGDAAKAKAEEQKVEIAKAKELLESNARRRTDLAQELPKLVMARQYLRWLDEKAALRESFRRTKNTVTLLGWIAKSGFETLEGHLKNLVPASAVLKVKADEGEEAPILLKNNRLLKPFESVTTLYGLPQASEVDPTPLLAPFFILFFGLCLTDAGYGITLAIIMAIFIKVKKIKLQDGPLWWLLMIGGIFTFFVSIPFGGWWGLTPDQVPASLTKTAADGTLLFKGQIWNLGATDGITFFQNLAIVLGLIHLSFGIFMAGFMKWRHGEKAGAFWVDWLTLVLFAVIAVHFLLLPPDLKQYGIYAIIATAVLLVWGKGHGAKWYLRPLLGLLGVLNLAMGMLSNTLSYLRLLALGLVTGALALAVNLVAAQFGALLPWFLAIPVSIVIYVLGHTVNIALNVLGAFIHSGRLQFVEFFGNFFEGGGRPYTPFKRSQNNSL